MGQFVSWIRFLLALAVTAVGLPFAWMYVLVFWLLVGIVDLPFLAVNVAALVVLFGLAAGLGGPRGLPLSPRAIGVLAVAAWTIGCAVIIPNFLTGPVPWPVTAAAFIVCGLWQVWLGWIFCVPMRGARRVGVLLGLVALQTILPATFRVNEVIGDGYLPISWRWRPLPSTTVDEITADDGAPVGLDRMGQREFPEFLGPRRDATVRGARLAHDWSATPPRLIWRRNVGAGWGAFAVAGGKAITLEQRESQETVAAYDAATGHPAWVHQEDALFHGAAAGPGPRSTPTITDGKVFTLGGTGILCALDLPSGERVWRRNIIEDAGGTIAEYGVAGSPLVLDDKVYVSPTGPQGPSLAAYDRATGNLLWKAGAHPASYSSPMLWELEGRGQILVFGQSGLAAHDPATGAELWYFEWNPGGNHAPQPVIGAGEPNRVLIAASDGHGCVNLSIGVPRDGQGWTFWRQWEAPFLKTKFSTPIVLGDQIIGLDSGILESVELAKGTLRWKKGRYKHGQILRVGDDILVLTEDGELVLVEIKDSGPVELGRVSALEGKTWNTLALAGELLFVRNATQAACYHLPMIRGE